MIVSRESFALTSELGIMAPKLKQAGRPLDFLSLSCQKLVDYHYGSVQNLGNARLISIICLITAGSWS